MCIYRQSHHIVSINTIIQSVQRRVTKSLAGVLRPEIFEQLTSNYHNTFRKCGVSKGRIEAVLGPENGKLTIPSQVHLFCRSLALYPSEQATLVGPTELKH